MPIRDEPGKAFSRLDLIVDINVPVRDETKTDVTTNAVTNGGHRAQVVAIA